MRKFFVFFILFVVLSFFVVKTFREKLTTDLSQPVYLPTIAPSPVPTIVKNDQKETTSLFVPYWAVGTSKIDTSNFDRIIYFGILPNQSGINKDEAGSLSIKQFLRDVPQSKQKLLALRMTDSQTNFAILKSNESQQTIISQTINLAKQNGFDGIVLDLEISAIPFDTLIQEINSYTHAFYLQAKAAHLSFAITVYGDTFYRIRPFDVKTLAQNSDTVMVMAYDFHKANGEPGPNFPLAGRDVYGYDLQKMTDDFLEFVPPQKLAVIFGLFGYDWATTDKNQSAGTAQALTDEEIGKKFLQRCSYSQCTMKRDEQSAEAEVSYVDDNQMKHMVWYEDMQSVERKEAVLQQKGIRTFSFWAYSYF